MEQQHTPPSAREQSLLRSLSAIRHSTKYHRSDSDGSDRRFRRSACGDNLRKAGRCGRVMPCCPDTAAAPPCSRDENFPPLPFPGSAAREAPAAKHCYRGYRQDYTLGEAVRSPCHMMADPVALSSLRVNDFVFVKRSDGSYSYAIVAYLCAQPVRSRSTGDVTMENCLVLAVSADGSTKTVRESRSDVVRLVATDEGIPPSVISFVPREDDACSVISSVSERARGASRC